MLIEFHIFSFTKMHLEKSSAKCLFCLGLNMLKQWVVAGSVHSHCLNRWWLPINCSPVNLLRWNHNANKPVSIVPCVILNFITCLALVLHMSYHPVFIGSLSMKIYPQIFTTVIIVRLCDTTVSSFQVMNHCTATDWVMISFWMRN